MRMRSGAGVVRHPQCQRELCLSLLVPVVLKRVLRLEEGWSEGEGEMDLRLPRRGIGAQARLHPFSQKDHN